MSTNGALYSKYILPNSASVQQKVQNQVNLEYCLDISPDRIHSFTDAVRSIGRYPVPEGYKVIMLDDDILGVQDISLRSKITYGTEYKLSDFMTLTNILLSIYHNGIKLMASRSYITVLSATRVMFRILDDTPDKLNYTLTRKKGIFNYRDFSGYTSVTLEHTEAAMKTKMYFMDGKLTFIPFVISNGIASYTISLTTNQTFEEFTIPNIWFNGIINTTMINGVPCLGFNSDRYIGILRYVYQADTNKRTKFNVAPVTYKYYQVDAAGSYYVVAEHSVSTGTVTDNVVSKFDKLFGSIQSNQSIVPTSFYNINDGLRELSQVPTIEIDAEIKKGFTKSPDLFKTIMENHTGDHFINVTMDMYKQVTSNIDIYPSNNPNYVSFGSIHRKVSTPKAAGVSILFADGLVASPSYIYEVGSVVHAYYSETYLTGKKLTIWKTGTTFRESNSHTITVPANKIVTLPPDIRAMNDYREYMVIEENWVTNAYTIKTGWSVSIVDDIATFTFTDADIDKTYKIYHMDSSYRQFIKNSKKMGFELPWYLMYSQDRLFVFTGGVLNPNYKIVPPVLLQTIKNIPMGINYQSNFTTGEDVLIVSAPNYELYEQQATIGPSQGIVTLNKKDFPFSKKYMIVFLNGKLVHPTDIVELSSFKFGLKNATSINDLRIYKLRTTDADMLYLSNLFKTVTSDWDTYINSLTYATIKTYTGITDLLNTDSVKNVVSFDKQYLYEILHKFIILNPQICNDATAADRILHDFAPIVTNGRIILDGCETGQSSRYVY